MAEIANWNGHSFVVSSSLIRGFTDLTIKGACETTDKNSNNQKYIERKYGEIGEVSMTVDLSALTGVTDVKGEALAFYNEANAGASAYFYLGGAKLIPAKLMLTSAQIAEIVHMPGRGDVWIQCKVALTFRQSSQNDGTASASATTKTSSSSTKKTTTSSSSKGTTVKNPLPVSSGYQKLKAQAAAEAAGKAASKDAKNGGAGLAAQEKAISATQTSKSTDTKKNATTGRAPLGGAGNKSVTYIALN